VNRYQDPTIEIITDSEWLGTTSQALIRSLQSGRETGLGVRHMLGRIKRVASDVGR
jgi:hypothetical protein